MRMCTDHNHVAADHETRVLGDAAYEVDERRSVAREATQHENLRPEKQQHRLQLVSCQLSLPVSDQQVAAAQC